ncbi:MAG: nucleotidyltransferase domain-containing protein [bacterium]
MEKKELLISQIINFFKEKARSFNIDMAFLYGSWARGYPREDSDIDIAILFSPEPTSEDDEFNLITEISLDLLIKFKKEISILSIQKDFLKPMLYYNAIVLGIPIIIVDFDRYISLKLQAISMMEDFSLFGIGWQFEAAKRNLMELNHV